MAVAGLSVDYMPLARSRRFFNPMTRFGIHWTARHLWSSHPSATGERPAPSWRAGPSFCGRTQASPIFCDRRPTFGPAAMARNADGLGLLAGLAAGANLGVNKVILDRKSVVKGKQGAVRVDTGGRRIMKKKKK